MTNKTVNGKVLSLCWGDKNTLYIGFDTGTVQIMGIGDSNITDTSITHPSLQQPVHSLAVKDNILAMGSRNIILWDIKNKTILKTLSGHANVVSCLHFDESGSSIFSR